MSDNRGYQSYQYTGIAIDPIHVGSGSSRLGRVDNAIVRDPVTRIPKIPGSSLAGVYRAYAAMQYEDKRQPKDKRNPYYPNCAGQGENHCGKNDCPICTVFGFAKKNGGGFAGLASFSDAHVLFFPVPTREGPFWVTSPTALRIAGQEKSCDCTDDAVHVSGQNNTPLNLGWLLLERKNGCECFNDKWNLPGIVKKNAGVVSDKLFSHIINSNLEVRTSVAINPETGAAEDGALFTYEALPRSTVLFWEVTCKNPSHFKVNGQSIQLNGNGCSFTAVESVIQEAHPYLEYLGVGGMTTRGMGRLKLLEDLPKKNGGQK
jgi:CRISPR-associated protein Cmr4